MIYQKVKTPNNNALDRGQLHLHFQKYITKVKVRKGKAYCMKVKGKLDKILMKQVILAEECRGRTLKIMFAGVLAQLFHR